MASRKSLQRNLGVNRDAAIAGKIHDHVRALASGFGGDGLLLGENRMFCDIPRSSTLFAGSTTPPSAGL